MSKIPEYYEDTAKLIKRGENDLSPEEMLKLIYTKQYLILDKNPHNILIEAIETIEKNIYLKICTWSVFFHNFLLNFIYQSFFSKHTY